jgi:hypothetical protein
MPAHAVQVSVSIGGLPPGLAPTVIVMRNTCPNGSIGWIGNPAQALSEVSLTVFERVTLPSGVPTLRSKVVTRYVAQFETPVTPATSDNPLDRRCSTSTNGFNADHFRFNIKVPGFNANGQATTSLGFVSGDFPQAAVSVSGTMSAKTSAFTPITSGALARGMVHTLDATYTTTMGSVQAQRLDFQRPSTLIPGIFATVASLFVRADGVPCVKAGSTTRCLGDGSFPEAGGVLLHGINRAVPGQPYGFVRFKFELMHSFATGTVRLSAAADATDLAAYVVDGAPKELNLLPWDAMEQMATVQ